MKYIWNVFKIHIWTTLVLTPVVWAQALQDRTFKGIIPAPDPTQTILVTDENGTEVVKNISLGVKIQEGTLSLSDIPLVIVYFIDILTIVAGTLAVIFLMYGGFQLMFSGATEDRQSAKNTVKWAIIGLMVTFLAWVIVNLVQTQLTS